MRHVGWPTNGGRCASDIVAARTVISASLPIRVRCCLFFAERLRAFRKYKTNPPRQKSQALIEQWIMDSRVLTTQIKTHPIKPTPANLPLHPRESPLLSSPHDQNPLRQNRLRRLASW